jgi:hypothetical protein
VGRVRAGPGSAGRVSAQASPGWRRPWALAWLRSGRTWPSPGSGRPGSTWPSRSRRGRAAPDPDEVTDTGARRARSAFRLATEDDEDEHDEEEPDEHGHEPALILQWGIFVAQTLTGAIAGLGVWLGFYRLWSTWPFYAVPAVGVAAIGMLVLARTLRRRHGRDLDLLTAVVTVGVSTVLTVLPAAFTLHGLTQ